VIKLTLCNHQLAQQTEATGVGLRQSDDEAEGLTGSQLASCLIYARALLEYVIFIMWLRSVIKMLPSVKFAEDKMLNAHFLYSP